MSLTNAPGAIIKYIGTESSYTDPVAGTGTWVTGEQRTVDDDIGQVLASNTYKFQKVSDSGVVEYQSDPVTGGIETYANGQSISASKGGLIPLNKTGALFPMLTPSVLGSPPSIVRGAANGATQLAGSVLFPADRPGAFRYIGGPARRTTTNPDFTGLNLGKYPQITSNAPTAVEFALDIADATGRFEIYHKGTGGSYRFLCRRPGSGAWGAVAATGTALPNDGNLYLELVTLGASGRWEVRIEYYFGVFFGIRAAASTGVIQTKKPGKRIIVAGDSFSEPTITDSGSSFAFDGFVQQLGYLTGYDFWSAGSGGTGWLQVNGGRPKMRDRVANDILAFDADEYWFLLGINDISQDSAAVAAEVSATVAMAKAAKPTAVVRVFSSFWKGGYQTYDVRLLGMRDQMKAAAIASGAQWHDVLDLGAPSWLSDAATFSTTLTGAYTSGQTQITIGALPAYFNNAAATAPSGDWYVCIGSGANQVVRKANGWASGTPGAFVLPIDSTLGQNFAAGTQVRAVGCGFLTGTGKQGTTTGDGNSDIYVGSDVTHPTKAGHSNLANVILGLVSQ